MFAAIKDGQWVNISRIKAVSAMMMTATILMVSFLLLTAHGTVDQFGRPLGTDFSNVWTAGHMALQGQAADAWDWASHFAVQRATHDDPDVPVYGWHYPPPFLLVAATLAKLPYIPALIIWQVTTLGLAVITLRAILPEKTALLAGLGFPVVLICLGHGHNGFLTGALFGGGLLLLDRRPLIAGLLLGCVIYKPQFGLVLPVILLLGGHWRAIGGALLSATLLCGLTLAIWGWPVWQAFLDSLPLTQSIVIEQGSTGWEKILSAFSAVRNWGGSVPIAWAVQTIVTLMAIIGAAVVARRTSSPVRNAVILSAALLSTPYVLDYDLIPLGMALAFLVVDGRARGFLACEKTIYALIWIAPLFGRAVTSGTTIPLGFIVIAATFILAMRRAVILDRVTAWPFRHLHEPSAL
ncbi:MAG: glycosyltransferase family 87 protein [Chakrabartia sp.]